MALMIGDSFNRGTSAPTPTRRLPAPAPRPVDDGPRGDRDRPRTPVRKPLPQQAAPRAQANWRAQQERKQFQVIPARPKAADLLRSPEQQELADLFTSKKKVAVDVVPEKPKVVTPGPWVPGAEAFQPKSIFDTIGKSQANQQIVQNVADQYDVKARLGQRHQARIDREAADRDETARPLTLAQWNAFTPLQQAAVQANFDLAAAVKRDFETQSKHKSSDAQFKGYQDQVRELFGEDRAGTGFKGLEYAPNTVAFLTSRGVTAADLSGKTLDDLVSGDALVDLDTVQHLGEKQPEWGKQDTPFGAATTKGPADARGQNILFAQQLAKGQIAYQEKLAATLKRGNQLLSDMTSRSTNAVAGESFGAKPLPTTMELPDVRPETAAQFDLYMEALARPDSQLDLAFEAINLDLQQRGATPKESEQVFEALRERARQGVTGEGKWFEGLDFDMRSPVEVAQALGVATLKRQTPAEGAQ